jgi:PAS domain S-box-containing protein
MPTAHTTGGNSGGTTPPPSSRDDSEIRYRALVETIPHGILELDAKGTITFANSAHARIYGYRADAMVGRSILDQCANDKERLRVKAHLAFIMDQQPHPTPWYGVDRTRDGRLINTQVEWNYRLDSGGAIVGLIAVTSDITHRKRAEKALTDNLSFMNTLIDTIPNPVFYKDQQGYFLGCNVAYAETLGLTKERILGRRLIDLQTTLQSDMAEHYHRQDLLLIQNTGIQTHEEKIRCADGVHRIFELNKATFSDAEDQVAGLVGIMLDITERKQALKALKESQDLFEAFMRHLPGLAFMKDPNGVYMYVNDSFRHYSGLRALDQIGLSDQQLWDTSTAEALQANDRVVLDSKTAQSHMETVQLSNHEQRYLLTARFPVFKDNRLFALGGISIDITERTLAQRQREQLELQLQQTQKMEALGTLAGGIAHDFNNILAAIIGYTEIVAAETEKTSDAYEYLQRVLTAGERARSLVKQILAFSRQGEMEPKPVQIKLIVKEVLKLLRASLPATIEIIEDIRSSGAVMADPTQIHQVMLNLGTNAGYAMGEMGGTLTVRLEETLKDCTTACDYGELLPGRYLHLTVSDTGKGIDPSAIGRIFDPFFTTKPKGEGTGMGLSVVHGIVTGLGGAITVESVPGRGARFDVFLPALEITDVAIAAETAEPLPTGNERILYVDDEVFQTDMLTHMLGLLGYQVQSCNTGHQALELFEKDPLAIDLVITDMIMPGMTGDALSAKLLALRPDLPIILATGYSEQMTEAKAKAMGIRAFTLKPVVMEKLARLIRQVLEKQGER